MPQTLRDLPDGIPCGLLDVGPDDRVLDANATLARWLGFSDGATMVERTLADLLTVGARMALETHIRPMLRLEGAVEELALDMRDASGHRVPFIANARELRDADGKPTAMRFALFRAVDRRTYERTLRSARRMAEDALTKEAEIAAFRERFIAVLGHDLRNPLAAVLSGLNVMERPGGRASPELLGAMRHSAERAVGLVDSIMDFAQGRLGDGIAAVRVPVPVRELAGELERLVDETRVLSSGHALITDWTITHTVEADLPRLSQLLGNLLSNARHHGEPGQPIRVTGTTTESEFRLSVTNHAPPIPPATRERLFEPFTQGGQTPATEEERSQGLGLGLFIVSQIADAHRGTMEVMSADGTVTFALTMPRIAPD